MSDDQRGHDFDPLVEGSSPPRGQDPSAEAETAGTASGSTLPSLPVRLVWVLASPGKLMDALAETPRWLGPMLVSVMLVSASVALIPPEIMLESQRVAAMERGAEFPEIGEQAVRVMRIVFPVASALAMVVFSFAFAGVYTLIFAFILGDEGRYVQYLAAVTHAWFIAALLGLAVTPLRIATEDPRYTLNLASFFFFLPDGYLFNVLRALDLTQIWSTLVIAQGAHAIDNRRSFKSAAVILLGILVALALLIGRFM